MKSYYRNKSRVIIGVIGPSFLLVIFSIGFMKIGELWAIFTGTTLLSPVIFLLYNGLYKPALIVKENAIHFNAIFGKSWRVNNISEYTLVLSNEFLAFRKSGQNDVMVDKKWFKTKQWQDLIIYLKSLAFQGVIE